MKNKTDKEEPEKRGRGRPEFKPTDKMRHLVRTLAGLGQPHPAIARMLGAQFDTSLHQETLRTHFRAELDLGKDEANAKVAGTLFKMAVSGESPAATFFWLKTQAGWKESPQQVAFTDPDGNPAPPPSLADFYSSVQTMKGGGDAD
jgi:hypothetical protein